MSRLSTVWRLALCACLAAGLLAAGCRKLESRSLDPVEAIRRRVEPRFRPAPDGLLTDAQVALFLEVRRTASGRLEASTRASGYDPEELAWVRARIVEALLALDTRQGVEAALDSYAKSIADLRETRRATRDAKASARVDMEIAALERDRASLRKGGFPPSTLKNAARIAPRRAEIRSLGP